MTKKNLQKVVSDLFFTEGEFVQGALVIESRNTEGDWDIVVTDTEDRDTEFYNYFDAIDKRMRSPRWISQRIWEDFYIKAY